MIYALGHEKNVLALVRELRLTREERTRVQEEHQRHSALDSGWDREREVVLIQDLSVLGRKNARLERDLFAADRKLAEAQENGPVCPNTEPNQSRCSGCALCENEESAER